MKGRKHPWEDDAFLRKHPWEDDAFLIEQIDYIMDRVVTAGAVFVSLTPQTTSDFEKKWDRLIKLSADCRRANVGNEGVERNFVGRFARILKLITDAYLEGCKMIDEPDFPASEDSPRSTTSPRTPSIQRANSGSRGTPGSPRVGSPRLDYLKRSLSSIKIKPGSPRHRLTGSEDAIEVATFINHDYSKHHYVRVLGLLLGQIYRLMKADILPSIREADKNTVYYESALRIEFPRTEKEGAYDYVRNMYDRLALPDANDPLPEPNQTSPRKTNK